MCTSSGSPARPSLADYLPWSVTVDGEKLNYGQIHEILHRDIAIGNDYRKERIKLLIALATGVFALTATFHKEVFGSVLTYTGLYLVGVGLALMIVSLYAGIRHFRKWEDFYLEHRARGAAVWRYHVAHAAKDETDKEQALRDFCKAGERIKGFQKSYRKWDLTQSFSLIIGMVLIAAYVFFSWYTVLEGPGPERVDSTQQAIPMK